MEYNTIIGNFLGRNISNLNWIDLMEVVGKIEDLSFDENLTYSVEIRNNGCRIFRSWTTAIIGNFGWHQTGDKKLSVIKAVSEFIIKVIYKK